MDYTVIAVAFISLFGTSLGTFGGIRASNKIVEYRLKKLEEKVDKHNNVIDRQYKTEQKVEIIKEKQKVANRRIDDLEGK